MSQHLEKKIVAISTKGKLVGITKQSIIGESNVSTFVKEKCEANFG